jgi:hypothetical protein
MLVLANGQEMLQFQQQCASWLQHGMAKSSKKIKIQR